MKYYLGIDPGKTGGLAIVNENGDLVDSIPMPLNGKELNVNAILEFIKGREIYAAAIERVSAMPGQGVSSMFSFGFGAGLLHGIVRTLGIPLHNPTPQTWQKVSGGLNGGNKKVTADWAGRLWPKHDFRASARCTNLHEGKVDASGIAYWLYKSMEGAK